jgi:hypothetical protein
MGEFMAGFSIGIGLGMLILIIADRTVRRS